MQITSSSDESFDLVGLSASRRQTVKASVIEFDGFFLLDYGVRVGGGAAL